MLKACEKKKLKKCLVSLNEIVQELRKLSSTQRKEVLSLCQQMAIEMGNMIEEKTEGETTVISLLEQYCEEIYHLYITEEKMENEKSFDAIGKLLSSLGKKLDQLATKPNEVLFLPYKAAMWDSLESIYHAAKKQLDCRVKVMPIPYYNINPQGEILSVEYEGELFPKNVEITDFREYDIKQMQPDAIFIHNPYDGYNYVTRVAPEYFSSELIKYTKRLIYIPYFVTSRNEIASHYCVIPGVKNAWRTFVQSEKIRQGYIQCMGRADSIVALGSPKFDKIKAIEENLSRVPKEWKSSFKNKKVFLLNIHLGAIINKAEMTLIKLEQLFHFFARRDDIALLWRPHPLSIETAKALNPDFIRKYIDLIEQFKTMSIGIYDESPDIHRAIAVSNGYIGNISSVVSLFGMTGKPIFIFCYAFNHIVEEKELNQEEIDPKSKEESLVKRMLEAQESVQYLYFEKFISLEEYVERVKSGRELCVEERINRFKELQYGFDLEETAGERIWTYVYQDILGEDNV